VERSSARIDIGTLPTIQADALQMRQLFQNLLANSLKFRRPGVAPYVRIDCERRVSDDAESSLSPGAGDASGIRYEISVEDNGIGFEEKYLDRIFTIFQRLHGRGTYEGTGVGLAVCRKIVDRHRGTITARSAPGEGATFVVTLPARQEGNQTNDPS